MRLAVYGSFLNTRTPSLKAGLRKVYSPDANRGKTQNSGLPQASASSKPPSGWQSGVGYAIWLSVDGEQMCSLGGNLWPFEDEPTVCPCLIERYRHPPFGWQVAAVERISRPLDLHSALRSRRLSLRRALQVQGNNRKDGHPDRH